MLNFIRVMFVRHKNREILFINLANCSEDEFKTELEKAREIIAQQLPYSLLTLTDFTDLQYNRDMASALKEFTAHNKPFVKAAAVVGVTGLKKIIYDALIKITKRKIELFDTLEAAKDWLIEQ